MVSRLIWHNILPPRDNPGNLTKSQYAAGKWWGRWWMANMIQMFVMLIGRHCHICVKIVRALVAEYGWHLLIFCSYTGRSCVCSQLVMSICSRGRLLQQQEQGQLTSWVTSSQENPLQIFSCLLLVFVCEDSFQSFRFLAFLQVSPSSSHFARALQAVSYGHMKQGQ